MASIYPDFQRTDYLIKALADNESQIKDVVPKAFYEAFSKMCETTISDLKVKPLPSSPIKKVADSAKKVTKLVQGDVHIRRTAGKVRKFYKCAECGKLNETATMLKTHFDRNHTTQKRFVCSVKGCSKDYTSQSSLNLHISRKHSNKQFQCERCPRSYKVLGDLTQHMRRGHGII